MQRSASASTSAPVSASRDPEHAVLPPQRPPLKRKLPPPDAVRPKISAYSTAPADERGINEREKEINKNYYTNIIVDRIRRASYHEYEALLSKLDCRDEKDLVNKFIVVLKKFGGDPGRKRQYALSRAMLANLCSEAREFVLRVLDENIFGTTRLNSLCRLEYFSVEVSVILESLVSTVRDSDSLSIVVRSFQEFELLNLIESLCYDSPEEMVVKMKKDDVYRSGIAIPDPKATFSDRKIRDLIVFICEKAEIEIPSVTVPLFARVRLSGEFEQYFEGRTEIEDFFKICTAYAKNEPSVLRLCLVLVSRKSNPLGKFFCDMMKSQFVPNSEASDYTPCCVENDALHKLACDRHYSLIDNSSVEEFKRKFGSSEYVAISYHQNTISGKVKCDFLSFRTDYQVFHYSTKMSLPFHRKIVQILVTYASKTVFVCGKDTAVGFLRQLFGWTPRNVVDAKDLARNNNIQPLLDPMTNALVGGFSCSRGTNFSGDTIPSQVALRHIDVMTSFIYEFCVRFGKYGNTRRSRDPARSYAERHSRNTDRSRSSH